MPAKRNQKFSLEADQFASLMQEVSGSLPAGVQLDESVLAALRQATNTQFNELADKKMKKKAQKKKENSEKAEEAQMETEQPSSTSN